MKKKIIILSSDPNSINSEIIYKSWKNIDKSLKKRIYLISNYNLMLSQFKKLNYRIKLTKVNNINEKVNDCSLKVIDVKLNFRNPFQVSKLEASRFIKNSLNLGHKISLDTKNVAGMINCPLDKSLLKKNMYGVTEYLAFKCGIKNNSEVMLLKNKKLSVSPITTHTDISLIYKKIRKEKIIKKVKIINNWFIKKFNKSPQIGILGLNPHNAELRGNSEEVKEIIPAITKLKKIGIKLKGPLVADTLFINEYKKFNVIVGMYHDQVLAPFKALFKFDAINITLGLKYTRVSPDHGIAKEIIGKNKANYLSLLSCISFLKKL